MRLRTTLVYGIVAALLTTACSAGPGKESLDDVRIYQVLPIPRKTAVTEKGEGRGEMVALINTGAKPHDVGGWQIGDGEKAITLPKKTVIPPGQKLYVANHVPYFADAWGFKPHVEYGEDSDVAVPNATGKDGLPVFDDKADVVRLLDAKGAVIDALVYGTEAKVAPWTGRPALLVDQFPVVTFNQVITRLRDEKTGAWLKVASADSFSNGTPTRAQRVVYAGQSDFPVRTVKGKATVTGLSSPDNSGAFLAKLIDEAKSSIRLVGYQFNNDGLADRLVAAVKRGVKVQVFLERNPGGSDMYDSDKFAQEKMAKGGVEILYHWDWDRDFSSRYNHLHLKYGIFDGDGVLVGTENYTNSSYGTPACGNRGWMVYIQGNKEMTALFEEVWNADADLKRKDIRKWEAKRDGPLAPDTYDAGPCLTYTPVKAQPVAVSGDYTVTRILSPENSFDRTNGYLGLFANAQKELLITANYIYKWWGSRTEERNMTERPQPILQEIVAAARRGVAVKVLLDRRYVDPTIRRDNHQVVAYLNDLAKKENLKLEARLVNMYTTGIGRTFHTKSLIVDGDVVISSINGSENSMRYGREMVVRVGGVPVLTDYYRAIFMNDWDKSAVPNPPFVQTATPRHAGTYLSWQRSPDIDLAGYRVYWRASEKDSWTKLGETKYQGWEDTRTTGQWKVTAFTIDGRESPAGDKMERK